MAKAKKLTIQALLRHDNLVGLCNTLANKAADAKGVLAIAVYADGSYEILTEGLNDFEIVGALSVLLQNFLESIIDTGEA